MQQPSSFLTRAVGLTRESLAGGEEAVFAFRELIMLLLGRTILDHKSFVTVQSVNWQNAFIIAPPRRTMKEFEAAGAGSELYSPLQLTNGHFLDLQYSLFVDPKVNFLKTDSSRMVYQSDDSGRDQLFRFEMSRQPANHYPFAHLHVNGHWKQGKAKRPKDMVKVHFPTPRPTIESLIRVLVYDFNVESKCEPRVFEPVLRSCEQEFLRVARTCSKAPQPLPP